MSGIWRSVMSSLGATLPCGAPGGVGRRLVRSQVNDRRPGDADEGKDDRRDRRTPAAIGLRRDVAIDVNGMIVVHAARSKDSADCGNVAALRALGPPPAAASFPAMRTSTAIRSVLASRIAIVGRGRMGMALAAALAHAGIDVDGPLGRGATGADADLVLLCVPDSQIAAAARVVAPGRLVGHCSGATTLAPLQPHEGLSFHPLITVSDAQARFEGAGCVIAGSTARALGAAAALARVLGMESAVVADEDRALYHAGASMASNYVVTVLGAAERMAREVGVERPLLVPLVRAAVENWARSGATRALTGPIARGDEATVGGQRAAVGDRLPDLLSLWDALTAETRALASLARRDP